MTAAEMRSGRSYDQKSESDNRQTLYTLTAPSGPDLLLHLVEFLEFAFFSVLYQCHCFRVYTGLTIYQYNTEPPEMFRTDSRLRDGTRAICRNSAYCNILRDR